MRYLGEYLIPIAALILVFAVCYWEVFATPVVLVKRLIKRMLA
ncbi:MAG TPA: hypothetical protein VFD75_07820 [Pyrinomonadaceae bacterium]|nr:hypothetical protein [Pyrinomonadaceae bacterium]